MRFGVAEQLDAFLARAAGPEAAETGWAQELKRILRHAAEPEAQAAFPAAAEQLVDAFMERSLESLDRP